jgi:hypothetical protein
MHTGEEFGRLWEAHLAFGEGGLVDYALPHAKHEFLRFLRDGHGAVFHGSKNAEIDILEPHLATGTGKDQALLAIYATADPVNGIFNAILDRSKLDFWDVSLAIGRYVVGQKEKGTPPWSAGTVYILDGASFEDQGNHVCFEAVHPLGGLRVGPDDLPILDQVELDTSSEENEAFCLVYGLVRDCLGGACLRTRRDPQGYTILWHMGTSERLFCRCYFSGSQKKVGLFDAEGREEEILLGAVEDLRQQAETLQQRAAQWL